LKEEDEKKEKELALETKRYYR